MNEILQLVINHKMFKPIAPIIHLQNKFNLDAVYSDYPSYALLLVVMERETP